MRSSIKFLVVSVVLLTAGIVFAGHGGGPHGSHQGACKNCKLGGYHGGSGDSHGNLFLDYADELDLTTKQVAKLNDMRLEKKKKKLALKHKKYAAKAELMKVAHSEKPDRKKIEKFAKEIGAIKGEMIALKYTTLLDARKMLSDKQKKKLDGMFSKYHAGPPAEATDSK